MSRDPPLDPILAGKGGSRVAWSRLPPDVRASIEDHLGSPVASAHSQQAGFDLRADNIVLARRDVFFVDWPHARVGAPWLDLAYFLPSVAMQGGPPPNELFWSHPLARDAQRRDVSSVVAGLAGLMLHGASQPPPGIPALRKFQLAQGQQAVQWLRHITSFS